MEYLKLFYFNRKLLCFGIVFTFFSCFGKTFLISQYIPFLLHDFNLSNTGFSCIYAVVTVFSGISLIYLGQLLDSTDLRKYALVVTLALIVSCLILAVSKNLYILALALFGLRLSGQGLMNHTSMTAISRFFKRCRGKALSISVLGHALGEATLPILSIFLISLTGWRIALIISSISIFLIIFPLLLGFLKNIPKANEHFVSINRKKKIKVNEKWSVRKILRSNQFYLLAPGIFFLPFVNTTLLFYLHPMSEQKHWDSEWVTACFIGYAVFNLGSSFFTGYLTERFKPVTLLAFNMLPLIAAFSVILLFEGNWSALPFLCFAGISNGFNLNLENLVITEVYGIRNLATVKSLYTTLTIIASALGPLTVGILLDFGYTFNQLIFCCLLICTFITINRMRGYSKKHKAVRSIWAIPKVILLRKEY